MPKVRKVQEVLRQVWDIRCIVVEISRTERRACPFYSILILSWRFFKADGLHHETDPSLVRRTSMARCLIWSGNDVNLAPQSRKLRI